MGARVLRSHVDEELFGRGIPERIRLVDRSVLAMLSRPPPGELIQVAYAFNRRFSLRDARSKSPG